MITIKVSRNHWDVYVAEPVNQRIRKLYRDYLTEAWGWPLCAAIWRHWESLPDIILKHRNFAKLERGGSIKMYCPSYDFGLWLGHGAHELDVEEKIKSKGEILLRKLAHESLFGTDFA